MIDGEQAEVQRYSEGSYFGELALLKEQPRAATVTALTDMTCAALQRGAFERLLGPVKQILLRDAANYEAYADQLA